MPWAAKEGNNPAGCAGLIEGENSASPSSRARPVSQQPFSLAFLSNSRSVSLTRSPPAAAVANVPALQRTEKKYNKTQKPEHSPEESKFLPCPPSSPCQFRITSFDIALSKLSSFFYMHQATGLPAAPVWVSIHELVPSAQLHLPFPEFLPATVLRI